MLEEKYDSRLEDRALEFKFCKIEKRDDIDKVKSEMRGDRILIISIKPLLRENIRDSECVLQELRSHASLGGYTFARMGNARILILPPYVRF